MILFIVAIIVSLLFLIIEIPVYINRREFEDLLIIFIAALMQIACWTVLFVYR